jgi:Family of unknown function (DUF5678)
MTIAELQWQKIPPEELERYRDAEWALHDPQVQQDYAGQWVVAYERRVLACGPNAAAVLERAHQLVPDPAHKAVFCAPEDSDTWLQHSSDPGTDFANA